MSRTHFEIIKESNVFSIRDLGSAGGVFFRISFGGKKALYPGMIFLIGKHQFTVSSIDDSSQSNDLEDCGETSDQDENEVELDNLMTDEEMKDEKKSAASEVICGKRCTLTCFLPDRSPFQGRSVIIDFRGATFGRRTSNTIPMTMEIDGEIVPCDNAISSVHARIEYNTETKTFFLRDGSDNVDDAKASTNGTWYRLSGPNQESPFHELSVGTEVLIGTSRFSVGESFTISEHAIEAFGASRYDDTPKGCAPEDDTTINISSRSCSVISKK
jgi:pSer/pThr/pTyr-binding forkhead associated (FHA) protein